MIVDSSVWISHLRGDGTPGTRRLAAALRAREPILLPDVVLLEVLRGARSPTDFLRLEQAFITLPRFAPGDPRLLARQAAHLYARCRWAGFTPRSGNDCLIACCAIEGGQPLLQEDQDFRLIARVEPALKLLVAQ